MIALAGLALLLQGGSPEVITRSRVDPRRGVDFHALVVPETVYVGQQATYQLGVFLDQYGIDVCGIRERVTGP